MANYWPQFAEVIECLLMFLLNVLFDLTYELDVFCLAFAIQNTPDSLYSNLTYQIKFPPPHPSNQSFSSPHLPPPPVYSNPSFYSVLKNRLIWICKILYWCSILGLFCKFCPKISLAFWCCLINLPVF